jgi:hypothetical protein
MIIVKKKRGGRSRPGSANVSNIPYGLILLVLYTIP